MTREDPTPIIGKTDQKTFDTYKPFSIELSRRIIETRAHISMNEEGEVCRSKCHDDDEIEGSVPFQRCEFEADKRVGEDNSPN